MPAESDDRRALYLRWRPLHFADVVGQEHVVRTLRNAVLAGAPAHAYLLAGPRGTGKTTIARILYRAVNCERPDQGDPCGECHVCQMALAGRTLDLVEIDAASNRGIDDIRDLREKVAFAPSEVRYRVYIVDEAHELTGPAWDAFLKTLEEPPTHAIFVLATTEAHKVPGTIVSRCQRFDFRRIRPEAIRERLLEIAAGEGLELERGAADRLARMARGGLRDAVSLLDQAASFAGGRVDLVALREVLGLSDPRALQGLIEATARHDAAAALELLIQVVDDGADPRLLADELVSLLRGLLYAKAGAGRALGGEFSADELAWLELTASGWDAAAIKRLLRAITDGLGRIRDSSQFQLHLELAVLDGCLEPGAAEQPGPRPAAPEPPVALPSPAPLAREAPVVPAPAPSNGAVGVPIEVVSEETLSPIAAPPAPSEAHVAETAEPPGVDKAAEPLGADEVVGLELIRQSWPRVIEWVRNRNSFVASYLQPAELREFRDGWLLLGFAFKVHHERVAEQKNRDLVELACQQVLGQSVRVRCEPLPPAPGGGAEELDLDEPVLRFALDTFGGRAEWVE